MNKLQNYFNLTVLTITLQIIVPAFACGSLPLVLPGSENSRVERDNVTSPLPTPTIVPEQPGLNSQPELSLAAQKVLAYVVARDGIPVEALIIAADHPTEHLVPGREFQVVTLQDTRPDGQIYKLLVDLETGQVLSEAEISDLRATAAEVHQAKYGKLEPALYERLQTLADDDTLSVMIWIAEQQGESVVDFQQEAFAALAEKYPEAREAMERSGIPYTVADQELAQRIRAEYFEMLNAEMEDRVQPLAIELKQQGFTIRILKGMPTITALLPKRVILALNDHSEVGTIYFLGEDPAQADEAPPPLPEECLSKETALAFETIEQRKSGDTGQLYEAYEPGLVVITRPEEIVNLSEWVTGEARTHLQTLDYETYFVLAVFQGWQGSGGYSVQIKCITRQDNTVNIYIQFQEPKEGEPVNAVLTSPYHLVQVQKVRDWRQDITLNLITDETNIVSVSHFIP